MHNPGTILLAEDNDNDALLMKHAFRKAEISNPLIRVRDGEETINYLSGAGIFADRAKYPLPILLLIDLKMPRIDGFEVLQWLQTQPALKRIPVTVLTSSDQQHDIERAHELGAASYLQKPNELYDLVALLKSLRTHWLIVEKPLVSA